MKYGIEGISDGKVIESVEIVKKAENAKSNIKKKTTFADGLTEEARDIILVNYRNGTQDVFELDEQKLKALIEIMDKQATAYVNKSKKNRFRKGFEIFVLNFGGAIIAASGIVFMVINPAAVILEAGLCMFGVGTLIYVNSNEKKKKNDVKKYELYVNKLRNDLQYYVDIVEEEKKIDPKVENVKCTSIIDLDSITLEEAKQIRDKVQRYVAIGKTLETIEEPTKEPLIGSNGMKILEMPTETRKKH